MVLLRAAASAAMCRALPVAVTPRVDVKQEAKLSLG